MKNADSIFNLSEYVTVKSINNTIVYVNIDASKIFDLDLLGTILYNVSLYLKKQSIEILYEKVFGDLSFKESYLNLKKEYHLNDKHPLSFIEGKPVEYNLIASITIVGVLGLEVEYYNYLNVSVSRTVINNVKYLYINNINVSGNNIGNEFEEIFSKIEKLIDKCNFKANDIIRTWVYINDIKSNYEKFNTARRKFFENHSISYSTNSNDLPASTCIEGKADTNSNISIDLVCIDKNSAKTNNTNIRRIYNKYQNEPEGNTYLFKPTFSRAISIENNNYKEIQISGTASINEYGETLYVNDGYKQIENTLMNIKEILSSNKMSFEDICQATCFFKDRIYYFDYLNVLEKMKINSITSSLVIGNVCREDLLFEIDAVAIK